MSRRIIAGQASSASSSYVTADPTLSERVCCCCCSLEAATSSGAGSVADERSVLSTTAEEEGILPVYLAGWLAGFVKTGKRGADFPVGASWLGLTTGLASYLETVRWM